ncbi:hypothetical protein HZ989_14350 [Brevundimonas sp. AJA228-03]|uniref:hypothetical protein n=1 Tax=Brevundimonas sp. AJA228-03 TaxID=2752515 RepID=UPI001ADFA3C8|nr:hypothetical protein [Brevundimonas sp. AJA228-03]QTN19377.1 hypothetical protein HZ989_14350 [Brevundimonas sp. AJA228-03]
MAWSDDEDDFNPPPYDPFGLLPQPEGAPAPISTRSGPRSGHRFVSETHWAAARDAYLDGESAASISARFGMAERTIRARAREQGWRRADQAGAVRPLVEYAVEDDGRDALIDDTLDEVSLDVLVERALLRVRRAIAADRAVEAGRWIRTHRRLAEMVEARRQAEAAARAAAEVALAAEPERFTNIWEAKQAERRILNQREADAYVASSAVLSEALSARLGPPQLDGLHGLHGADEIFSGDP